MAFSPIALTIPNYRDFKNYWIKAYVPSTTTPKVMASDKTGSPTVAKFELNTEGFPKTSGGALITPYIDGLYDLWLFPTEAEADANDTSNALRLAINVSSDSAINDTIDRLNPATLTIAIADTRMVEGDVFIPEKRTTAGGGGTWRAVLKSSVTISTGAPGAGMIVASTGVPTLAFVLNVDKGLNLNELGAGAGIIADDNAAFQEAVTVSGDGGYITCDSDASFETNTSITGVGARRVDLLGAAWKYSGVGLTMLRLQPNSRSDITFATPPVMTVTQSSFNPIPTELQSVGVGDILQLESNDINLVSVDGNYLKGQLVKVTVNDGSTLQFYPNIVDDFTAHRVSIVGKTEGTNIKNINIDCAANVTNNSIMDIILQSSIEIENVNIIGSGFQNIGLKASGVDITISDCSIVGVANNYTAPGYGIDIDGTNITVKGISGTKCRHLVDGGSRAHYSVNIDFIAIHASKDDGAPDNEYILGMHANCRGFSITGGSISGSGSLASIRGGEGTISGVNFLSTGSDIFADITLNEEGCRNVIIDSNTFTNAFGVSGNTCVRLTTAQDNDSLVIANNSINGDDRVLLELINDSHNINGVVLDGNNGTIGKMVSTVDGTAPPPRDIEILIRNNNLDAAGVQTGYYVEFGNAIDNLSLTMSNNRIRSLTGSGMLGITGAISGDLSLDLDDNDTRSDGADSYHIRPTSIGGNFAIDATHNNFDGEMEISAPAATYSNCSIVGNNATHADWLSVVQTNIPVVIQGNITTDASNWRFVNTTLPEAMIGNVNTSGIVTANGGGVVSFVVNAKGDWLSNVIPSSLAIASLFGIDDVRRRNPTIGAPKGWLLDNLSNWVSVGNL